MAAYPGGEAVLVAFSRVRGHLSRVYYGKCLLWIKHPPFPAFTEVEESGFGPFDAMRGADMLPFHAPPHPVVERGGLHLYDAAPSLRDRGHVARTEHHRAQQVAEFLPAPFPCAV